MMDFVASEALMSELYAAVCPASDGQPIGVEWAQFQPDSPWFAIPHAGPRPWPFPMLVEYEARDGIS